MIIGSILLGIAAVLVILGLMRDTLRDFRVSNIVMLVVLIACPFLMFIPAIGIGGRFSFTIAGFIIPILGVVYLAFTLDGMNLAKAALAALATAAVVTLAYLFVPFSPVAMLIVSTVITGIVAGGVAYLVAGTSNGGFASALLGVVLADITVFIINVIRGVHPVLALGTRRSFDVWVAAGITAVAIYEMVKMYRNRSASSTTARQGLRYEFGDELNYGTAIEKSDEQLHDNFEDK